MKNRIFALLLAAAMAATMAPAALAEDIQAETVAEAAAVEAIAAEAAEETAPAEEVAVPAAEATTEEAAPVEASTDATEAVDETTVEAAPAEVKEPETITTGEDIDLETMYMPSGITLGYATLKINVGESIDVKAIVTPYDHENSNAALNWTTSDKNYFTVKAREGNLCSITGVKATATGEILTVSSVQNPGVTVSCRVFVGTGSNNRPIIDVTLNQKTAAMSVNDKLTLTATFVPGDTTSSKALYWGSDDRSIASVEGGANNTGIITAKKGGTAHIYVETSNGKYAYCTVTVGSIALNETNISLTSGSSRQLTTKIEGNDKTVQWSSSDNDIATVDANGVVNAVGAGRATITAKLASGLTATCAVEVAGDLAKVTAFVTRMYETCLGRTPDTAGLVNWTNGLIHGAITGTDATVGFVFGQEFKNKNYCNSCFTKQLYRALMGREFDQPGLDSWVAQLNAGMTREAVFNGFTQSVEFRELCRSAGIKVGNPMGDPGYGKGTMPTGVCSVCGFDGVTPFVTRLYEVCLLRKPDAGGLKNWVDNLYAHNTTGRDVAYGFIFSNEFKKANYNNEDYVERLYQAFMGRASDAPGKSDWVGKLNAGYTREQVFEGFVGSQEFMRICGTYGILRG